ncbi:MAG: UDP-glucose 4-epimerase GalE [Chlamydiae bacterium]|nr:UDP-glucose 4-epimerase GalE [Chlamydiota bacterium]MBI3266362.1 UDP-glucose 4-epimerase GalE [Chlamydiota bacterium]
MKILVTGGAGYIGSVTTQELLNQGHEVTVLDHLKEGHPEAVDKRADFIQGDIADATLLKKTFSKKSFDAVMHFAASCLVPESVSNPSLYYQNNVTAGLCLLEAMRENQIPKIIFSSSCAIYGNPEKMPITEETHRSPTHPYGETKWAFENILKWYSQAYGLKAVSLRYFNAAGATEKLGEVHDPETHLIPNVLKAALGHLPHVEIYGNDYPTPDGTCVRDYIHILDIAQAHILTLKLEQTTAFNLGNGHGYSVKEVIQTTERVCRIKIPTKISPRRWGDPPSLIANSQKIEKELGWRPRYPALEGIITSAWKWLQNHPEGYSTKTQKTEAH